MKHLRACWVAAAHLHGLVPSGAAGQETRADTIAAAQAEKAQHLAPYVPSKAERIAADVQRRLFATPNGFYPWFDSVYSGGGLTLGAGFRRFYGDRTFWAASSRVSTLASPTSLN